MGEVNRLLHLSFRWLLLHLFSYLFLSLSNNIDRWVVFFWDFGSECSWKNHWIFSLLRFYVLYISKYFLRCCEFIKITWLYYQISHTNGTMKVWILFFKFLFWFHYRFCDSFYYVADDCIYILLSYICRRLCFLWTILLQMQAKCYEESYHCPW